MGHYAKVKGNKVIEVIVAEESYINSLPNNGLSRWVKTSYNTSANKHSAGGTPLRKNFAGVGAIYNEELDAFIHPSVYPSWILNEDTCQYEAPVVYLGAEDSLHYWNEDTLSWDIPKP
jgi:hypothetical protein